MDKKFCIFDLDGTLLDSMNYWRNLATNFLGSKGIVPTREELRPVGTMTLLEGAAHFARLYGLTQTPETLVAEMEEIIRGNYHQDIPLKPGVSEYLDRLSQRGVTLCVATATGEHLVGPCLSRQGILEKFEFLLSGETLQMSKRDPDIFLLAAEKLGANPRDIAVFEDAKYAAETAKKAGFYTVAVWDNQSEETWGMLTQLADETWMDWREAT